MTKNLVRWLNIVAIIYWIPNTLVIDNINPKGLNVGAGVSVVGITHILRV